VIVGTVTARSVPMVSIEIAGIAYRAVTDTGFNGDLELPESLRDKLNARWAAKSLARLAGGVSIIEDVYLVDFPFDGRTVEAEASFVKGDEILVGTKLLSDHCLEINFVEKTVRIERVRFGT
jgi:predicted aspartyl protease